MTSFLLVSLFAVILLLPFYLYRAVRGPHVFDRLIGLNGIATKSILILILIGAAFGQVEMFLDVCIGYGLINLVGALAAGKYLERREI